MSCCGPALTEEEKKAQERSKTLDEETKKDAESSEEVVKLLFLGCGDSGKSTIFKQAIRIYGKGFSTAERRLFLPAIVRNILTAAQTLVQQSTMLVPPHPVSPECAEAAELLLDVEPDEEHKELDVHVAAAISQLWADPGIKATFSRSHEYQLDSSASYFLSMVQEISKPTFIPSDQDVLQARVVTTGIVETNFVIDGHNFRLVDVGGQRNERKKWIHCFEHVNAVLFVAAISEYNQKLVEDKHCNRMTEALALFDDVINSKWFGKTSVILFLNKKDLFAEKIKELPITVCPEFKSYKGPMEYEACAKYIQGKFEKRLKKEAAPDKQIITHITKATDKENIKVVLNAVKEFILASSLQKFGLI